MLPDVEVTKKYRCSECKRALDPKDFATYPLTPAQVAEWWTLCCRARAEVAP